MSHAPVEEQPEFGKLGICPVCGVLTQRRIIVHRYGNVFCPHESHGGKFQIGTHRGYAVDACVSEACGALGLWIEEDSGPKLVYPLTGARRPPAEGLEDREAALYEEAAALATMSPRAACALVRVLLEAFLKRHLDDRGKPITGKSLAELIDLAVSDLDLSSHLRNGLTAIRKKGNRAVHDPYGLTDDARAEDLPWLFQAVDSLVDELHTNPKMWAELAN